MDDAGIRERLSKYRWYHKIHVQNGIYTTLPGYDGHPFGGTERIWDYIIKTFDKIDFRGKSVLDIGCRDGLFSFEAEKRGAKEVIGIDSYLSKGATEFLIPFFGSKVKMQEISIYDMLSERFGKFDIIFLFSVVNHLRYPFWGLRKAVNCLENKGLMLLEIPVYLNGRKDLLWCPVKESPQDLTSCTFFNERALKTTMECFSCKYLWKVDLERAGFFREVARIMKIRNERRVQDTIPEHLRFLFHYMGKYFQEREIQRKILTYQRDEDMEMDPAVWEYWHNIHTLEIY